MKRRTLDVLFSAGGIALAGLLLVLGLVMTSNANFAKGYVKDQLSQQHITFTPADALTAEEKQSACLVKYAGQPLTTGKQAECYANDYIGLHLKSDRRRPDLRRPRRPAERAHGQGRRRPGRQRPRPRRPAEAADDDHGPARDASSRARPSAGCCSPRSGSASSA